MNTSTSLTTLELLAAHPFLDGLPAAWLDWMSHRCKRSVHHAGARLFSEGRPAERFWLIRDGRVSLELDVPGRGEVSIEHIGAGSVLGWSWMFPPYRWHFTAVAAERVFALELDGPGIRYLCDHEPALGYELSRRFSAVLIDRLQAARGRMLDLYAPDRLRVDGQDPTSSVRSTSRLV
jgi:CRP-like cAMP-binding protein